LIQVFLESKEIRSEIYFERVYETFYVKRFLFIIFFQSQKKLLLGTHFSRIQNKDEAAEFIHEE
jgi:hypothetical protein